MPGTKVAAGSEGLSEAVTTPPSFLRGYSRNVATPYAPWALRSRTLPPPARSRSWRTGGRLEKGDPGDSPFGGRRAPLPPRPRRARPGIRRLGPIHNCCLIRAAAPQRGCRPPGCGEVGRAGPGASSRGAPEGFRVAFPSRPAKEGRPSPPLASDNWVLECPQMKENSYFKK